jgi:hypothetical protein
MTGWDRGLAVVLAALAVVAAVIAGWFLAEAGAVAGALAMSVAIVIAAALLTTALSTLPRFRRSWPSRALTACAVALAIAGVAALIVGSDEAVVDKDAYLAANRRVLATLPAYPGAKRIGTMVAPYYEEGRSQSPIGYTTLRRYRLPPRATVDGVAAFYRSRLRGRWQLTEEIPGDKRTGPVLNFARDGAIASVNLESKRQRVLEISVESGYYAKLGRGHSP